MLLHSTISQSPLQNHHSCVSLSSSLSNTLSFPSAFRSSTFLRPFRKTHNKDPIVCCSLSSVERSKIWNSLYRRISFMKNPEMGAGSVLNQLEKEGRSLFKWQLCRTGQELRKFRRYKLALEVYEWMNRAQKFKISSHDAAIQLDLIAKVRGILDAEDYFLKLSDTLKDTPTYLSLLSVYVWSKSREKAESLMEKMKAGGYSKHSQAYNMMMSLYMRLKEYDKVDLLASEMRQENISLDAYSYNMLISSWGSRGSFQKMEQVFEQMKMERTIKLDWSTFTMMASMYIKFGELEKAEIYIKSAESRIEYRDQTPYHYVITLYCSVGKKEEVYRVWNVYKSKLLRISNLGYNIMISSLIRLDDFEGAELFYEEWKSAKSTYEPRIINSLMYSYVKNELFVKAEALFDQIFELGGKPDSRTWEILAERHIRESSVSDALTCLKEALLVGGSTKWKPRPANVSSILKICEKNDDAESKGVLMDLLRQVGCFEDEDYMSFIPSIYNEELPMEKVRTDDEVDEDNKGDEPELLLNVLQQV